MPTKKGEIINSCELADDAIAKEDSPKKVAAVNNPFFLPNFSDIFPAITQPKIAPKARLHLPNRHRSRIVFLRKAMYPK